MPAGGELGIKAGEYWAYRQGTTHPLQRALIRRPGHFYEDGIRVRLVDDPAVTELWTNRAKLPCRWADVDEYLLSHPDVPRDYPEPPGPGDWDAGAYRMAFTANELRSIIHDELANALGVKKVAYTRQEAAIATGVSLTMIDAAVHRNDLVARYAGSKPLFTAEELHRWVSSLPEAPWRMTYR